MRSLSSWFRVEETITMLNNAAPPPPPASLAWWRYGHVWLVLAGPLVVIIASFITLWLAVTRPDPVLSEDYYRKGVELSRARETADASLAPAISARNHAATGGVARPAAAGAP
jgi:uncharacterized protein